MSNSQASTVAEVAVDRDLLDLDSIVVSFSNYRAIEKDCDEEGVFDDGPRAKLHERVFSIIVRCNGNPKSSDQLLYCYFYDIWADKCKFLTEGDRIIVSGPSRMILKNPLNFIGDEVDHKFCLVFYEHENNQQHPPDTVCVDVISKIKVAISDIYCQYLNNAVLITIFFYSLNSD